MQEKPNNIVLIGPMGSGKTTVGRRLAERLKIDFFDADHEIIDKTGVSIDINDDGLVSIASADAEAAAKAVEFVENLTQEVEVGKIYLGKVKKIVDFGAFVEIFPGTDGLVHISQICDRRIHVQSICQFSISLVHEMRSKRAP